MAKVTASSLSPDSSQSSLTVGSLPCCMENRSRSLTRRMESSFMLRDTFIVPPSRKSLFISPNITGTAWWRISHHGRCQRLSQLLQDLYSLHRRGRHTLCHGCGSGLRTGEQAPRFSSARGVSTMLLILYSFFQGFSRIRVVPSPSLLRTFTLSIKLSMTAKPRPALSSSGAVVKSGCIACSISAIPQPLSLIFM